MTKLRFGKWILLILEFEFDNRKTRLLANIHHLSEWRRAICSKSSILPAACSNLIYLFVKCLVLDVT